MEWNNTISLKLIELYREYECLWNPIDENYKNKLKKVDAWNAIAIELKCTADDAKKKMESLLGSFRRERQKEQNSLTTGSGAEDTYKSTWFAFKHMLFLMDKFVAKKTVNTEELLSEEHSNEMSDRTQSEEPEALVNEGASSAAEDIQKSTSLRKGLKRPSSRADEAYALLKTAEKRLQRDQSGIFGDHVAAKHRCYSTQTKSIVEHLIGNILFNADMGYYEQGTHRPNTIPASQYAYQQSSSTSIPNHSIHSDHHSNITPIPSPITNHQIQSPSPHSTYQLHELQPQGSSTQTNMSTLHEQHTLHNNSIKDYLNNFLG